MAIIKKTLPAVVILIIFCILGAGIYSKEQRSETMVKINDIAINIEYIKVRHVKTDRTDELLFDESTSLDLVELLNDTCFKLSEDMPKIEPEEYYMITFNSRQYLVVMPEIIDGKIFSTYTNTDSQNYTYISYYTNESFLEKLRVLYDTCLGVNIN